MDFTFTPEQEALRREFAWFFSELEKEAPPGWALGLESLHSSEGWAYYRRSVRKLADKGWLVRHWPREYGGQDAPIIDQIIFNEEMGYHKVPGSDHWGVGMIGPTLLAVGNEEQKREHLPPIARAEIQWAQGWSEPGAGSDLASLTTRAVRDGDDYIINGQKTWNTAANRADWMFMVARADPAQKRSRGISFFLLDLKTPGGQHNPHRGNGGLGAVLRGLLRRRPRPGPQQGRRGKRGLGGHPGRDELRTLGSGNDGLGKTGA
ncbi:acyl-CoA dehydrogenase family protein [Chloroflexota bacterium]